MKLEDLDIERISRAFSPALEITDPRNFAGRKEEIRSAVVALQNRGGFLAVFGLRGVGKTSIGMQIKAIAEGDKSLPRRLRMEGLLPKKGFNYIVNYYTSDGFISNTQELVQRILFGDENNRSLFDLTKAGNRKLEEFKKVVSAEGGASLFGAKIGATGTQESSYSQYVSDSLIQQFRSLLGTVQKDNQERTGILILVDEFDTIEDKSGFASIVKACSSNFVKFGVIGIGTNVIELMHDHQSIGRQIDTIQVPTMPQEELSLILETGEYIVDHTITFDENAKTEITQKSEGFPYFTHLLGKETMVTAFEYNSSRVTDKEVQILSERISGGRLSTIYEDIYHEAVKHSPQRELLLKLFAEQSEDEINTESIYTLARDMDITNPSQLMQQLTRADQTNISGVLTKVRDRYYRFTDPVFKVYARLRSWKFD